LPSALFTKHLKPLARRLAATHFSVLKRALTMRPALCQGMSRKLALLYQVPSSSSSSLPLFAIRWLVGSRSRRGSQWRNVYKWRFDASNGFCAAADDATKWPNKASPTNKLGLLARYRPPAISCPWPLRSLWSPPPSERPPHLDSESNLSKRLATGPYFRLGLSVLARCILWLTLQARNA